MILTYEGLTKFPKSMTEKGRAKKMKEKGKIFELAELVTRIEQGNYFVDFLNVRNIEAGVMRLLPKENDIQTSHDADELYFIAEGSGFIEMGLESKPVKKGTVIFVPARLEHHFYGNDDTLVVLYIFAE